MKHSSGGFTRCEVMVWCWVVLVLTVTALGVIR